MTSEEYLIELARTKDGHTIGELLGKAIKDRSVNPQVYEAMCNTAKDKGFKFVNIQLT